MRKVCDGPKGIENDFAKSCLTATTEIPFTSHSRPFTGKIRANHESWKYSLQRPPLKESALFCADNIINDSEL